MSDTFLVLASFVTSTLTALVGLGGGTLLISVMPGVLPATAIVPVHGLVQLASNLSRAGFAYDKIRWRLVLPFVVGAVFGAATGSTLVDRVPVDWLPFLLGGFILVVTWLPRPQLERTLPGTFVAVGGLQTFASMFVGIAGPLNVAPLLREGLSRDRLVATDAAMNSSLHLIKVLAFAALGFSFGPYLKLILAMVVAVSAGSWIGTRLRAYVPEHRFRTMIRILLTLLALRILYLGLTSAA